MSSRSAVVVLAGCLVVALAGVAHAGPPNQCKSGRNLTGYNVGKQVGAYITASACQVALADPDQLEAVKAQLISTLASTIGAVVAYPSTYSECRALGTYDGAIAGLDACQEQVIDICILDGEFWGGLSSAIFCELAIAFGGWGAVGMLDRKPANLCGAAFEATCEQVFVDDAKGDPECKPYTKGPNKPAFQEATHNMCTYEFE